MVEARVYSVSLSPEGETGKEGKESHGSKGTSAVPDGGQWLRRHEWGCGGDQQIASRGYDNCVSQLCVAIRYTLGKTASGNKGLSGAHVFRVLRPWHLDIPYFWDAMRQKPRA